jgi:hypothetical protein
MYTKSSNWYALAATACAVLTQLASPAEAASHHRTSRHHARRQNTDYGAANVGRSEPRCADDDNNTSSARADIWQPEVGATWQIVLYGGIVPLQSASDIVPDVDIYDLDVFDNDVQTFRVLQNAGKKVICYFSAGSYEEWRDDAGDFEERDMGSPLDGWDGERWLDISSPRIRDIMARRIEVAASKGCDAVDPDNVDGYNNENGLGLTEEDTIDFVRFLSEQAHSHGMAVGLKNADAVIPSVLDLVEFSVNEQCIEYKECEKFEAFIDADKPVFNIEYPESAPIISDDVFEHICSDSGDAAGSGRFSKVIKEMDVLGWVKYCDGNEYVTPLPE